jgi:two-component system, sensor histidine kinase
VSSRGETRRRVLIVEDNADVRQMLRTLLEIDGHEVHEAADGPTGVAVGLDVRPDVAFVDIGLPGLDGYDVARALLSQSESGPPMLVALTGYGRAEDRRRMEENGFEASLIKPVDPDRIREVLQRVPRRGGALTPTSSHGRRACRRRGGGCTRRARRAGRGVLA